MPPEIDVRGLSCPQPVIEAKRAIDRGDFPVVVIADTRTTCENVRRAAEGRGCSVLVDETGDQFSLTISR